ncbi:hypothetical protein DPSP01_005523 [Paraphaeosphaeria sporulosa]
MVDLTTIHASNASLPTHLTAVFVGGTSGIGLYTLLALARRCKVPNIYFIGRSQQAADRILADLHTLNPNGTYTFIPSDVSLIKNVDAVCAQIAAKESHINILCLSQGTMSVGQETSEGMHLIASLILHSRIRFTVNLLPLLRAAPGTKRVVSIFTGTKEGPLTAPELQMRTVKSPLKARGQAASAVTLLLEEMGRRAPEVGFVHTYPGFVSSNIGRDFGVVVKGLGWVLERTVGKWLYIPVEESGERNLWLCTSGRFAGAAAGEEKGVEVAVGTDGRAGSGVYTIDEKGESGCEVVLQVLRDMRVQKRDVWAWEEVRKEFLRITGKESM